MLTRLAPGGVDLSSVPVHAIALAAYPVLFLFAENAEQQVTLAPLWMPLLISLGGGAVLLLIAIGLTRDMGRGGLLASLLLALFFSFGHVFNLIGDYLAGNRIVLAGAWIAAALALGYLAWRGGRWVAPLNRFLNVAAILLVAFNAFRVANYASESAAAAEAIPTPSGVEVHAPQAKRDIYYIILDRYANLDTLRTLYEFDNEPFLRELEARGFSVARDAWANYFKTALSVYSSLSMEHIDPADLNVDVNERATVKELHAALRDHLPVPAALKALGYSYVHLGNWWEPSATNVDADVSLRFAESAEFAGALWSTTALSLIWPPAELGEDEPGVDADEETLERRDIARATTLYAFDRLEESAGRDGPTYVYAHFLVPHPPYVFDPDGSMPSEDEVGSRPERANYVRQLRWTNDRVLQAIDRLMAHPPGEPDPIIVLQADEGPWPVAYRRNPRGFEWLTATPEQVQQKFGILNAVRLPGVDPAALGFHDRTSPVNNFRIVFNAYFDAQLPLLPDVTYLSPDIPNLYDFVEYPR